MTALLSPPIPRLPPNNLPLDRQQLILDIIKTVLEYMGQVHPPEVLKLPEDVIQTG